MMQGKQTSAVSRSGSGGAKSDGDSSEVCVDFVVENRISIVLDRASSAFCQRNCQHRYRATLKVIENLKQLSEDWFNIEYGQQGFVITMTKERHTSKLSTVSSKNFVY